MKLATGGEGHPKAPFSIATTLRCWERCYSFSWIAPFYSWGGINYYLLSLWYDSTWDWTPVSRTIGEHSTHKTNGKYPYVCLGGFIFGFMAVTILNFVTEFGHKKYLIISAKIYYKNMLGRIYLSLILHTHTHSHIHIHLYIYIYYSKLFSAWIGHHMFSVNTFVSDW